MAEGVYKMDKVTSTDNPRQVPPRPIISNRDMLGYRVRKARGTERGEKTRIEVRRKDDKRQRRGCGSKGPGNKHHV